MLNKPTRTRIPTFFFMALPVLMAVGCGESLSDEAYGAIDLASFFYDGSTPSNPTGGLPKNLVPKKGWVNFTRVEHYDFGLVSHIKKRTATSTSSDPDYVKIPQMFFFYRKATKAPLFSNPVFEKRTGLWHMRGGKNVLDPNPNEESKKDVPYGIRVRSILAGGGDAKGQGFQRPIIDKSPRNDSEYSGLWEIVEVLVPDDYDPDSIKHDKTLTEAMASSDWVVHRTSRVINCPLIDDRTYVTPSVFAYGIPRPRMEVWYRTKLGSCYLVNGWEALGGENNKLFPASGCVGQNACKADDRRLDTFDAIRYTIGVGVSEKPVVTSPVGVVYDPVVRLANQDKTRSALDIRYNGDSLSDALPRHTADDPIGYRPVKWHWDLEVPQDPPYQGSRFKDKGTVDPSAFRARSGTFTRNYPIVGAAISCLTAEAQAIIKQRKGRLGGIDLPAAPPTLPAMMPMAPAALGPMPTPEEMAKFTKDTMDYTKALATYNDIKAKNDAYNAIVNPVKAMWAAATKTAKGADDPCVERGLVCNEFPELDIAVSAAPAGSYDTATAKALNPASALGRDDKTLQVDFEGGPRCDIPVVGFGQFCTPGVKRCDPFPADPNFKADVYKADDPRGEAYVKTVTTTVMGVTTTMKVPQPLLAPEKNPNWNEPNAKLRAEQGLDYRHSSVGGTGGPGFTCHPNPTGYCYIRCDADATNDDSGKSDKQSLSYKKDIGRGKTMPFDDPEPQSFARDTRCGGGKMLGYTCASPTAAAGYATDVPSRMRVCLRGCSTRNTDALNDAICRAPFYLADGVNQAVVKGEPQVDDNGKPILERVPVREVSISRDVDRVDITAGTRCETVAGVTACAWNPAYEPRASYPVTP